MFYDCPFKIGKSRTVSMTMVLVTVTALISINRLGFMVFNATIFQLYHGSEKNGENHRPYASN
jgi:hypothetical protein